MSILLQPLENKLILHLKKIHFVKEHFRKNTADDVLDRNLG